MTNNTILQKIQYALRLEAADILRIYKQIGVILEPKLAIGYFIDTKHENYVKCPHDMLCAFLEGLIIEKRGVNEKSPNAPIISDEPLTNNAIFKKLRVALDFHDEDIRLVLERAKVDTKKIDLSALFRKKGHKHYKACVDSVLESFLIGIRVSSDSPAV